MQSVWQRLRAQLVIWFPRTSAYLKQTHHNAPVTAVKGAKKPAKAASASAEKKPNIRLGYTPFKITAAQVKAMQADVARAVEAGLISAPSPEQWPMIVAKKPITRVFAGAGSGKSTTLVLRILFMLKHLQIPRASLTVISFTNASCTELRERLLSLCEFFNHALTPQEAAQLVRTFHSAMGVQARHVWPNVAWFEQLDNLCEQEELDQPLASSLKPAQLALLASAFAQASQNHSFSEKIAGASASSSYRLAGMVKAQPLLELFFQEGSFAQCLGLKVSALKADPALSAKDKQFVEALALFWPYFTQALAEKGLSSFDQAFAALTEKPAPLTALRPMQHVLIDEFQDISPQILNWLLVVQARLAKAEHAVSLMAIGDDWQSIYGWRGSSPELFIEFDRHLKRQGISVKSQVLSFVTNYRCESAVLASAQRLLAEVALKQDKACVAANVSADPQGAVRLVQGFDSRTELSQVQALIEQLLAQNPATRILVLSRRNQELKRLKPLLKAQWPVRLLSIHRAKGLEADVAIILDNCQAPLAHPLRSAMYQQAGLFGLSYDQAMNDEALRLGYVAMTRAKKQLVWFTQKAQGATSTLG